MSDASTTTAVQRSHTSISAAVLDGAIVCFLLAATILVDFLENYTHLPFRTPFLAASLFCGWLRIGCAVLDWKPAASNQRRRQLPLLFVYIPIASLLALPFWYDVRASNYYLGPLIAWIIFWRNDRLARSLVVWVLLLNVAMQTTESLTGHYFYVVSQKGMELSELFFSGELNVFRAKGLFQGPLTANCFAVSVAFIHRRNLAVLGLALTSVILANGRLGIGLVFVLIGLALIQRSNQRGLSALFRPRVLLSAGTTLTASIIGAAWYFQNNPKALIRILDAADVTNAQNLSRVFYWQSAITAWSGYDIPHKIFGNLGYFRVYYGNSAESDWLMILLDIGVLGFLFYLGTFTRLFYKLRHHRSEWPALILLFFAMNLYTHSATPVGNVLMWLFLFEVGTRPCTETETQLSAPCTLLPANL